MLTKETIEALSKVLGTSAEDISAKIKSEQEEALEIPTGDFFSEEQLSKRDSAKYNEGKHAGTEILVKDLKKKYGYEIEGKDIDTFFDHHDGNLKEKYSKDNSEKVKDLESDLKKMKETYEMEVRTEREKLGELTAKLDRQARTNKLLGLMPKDTTIKKDAIITLFNSEYSTIEEDGVTYVVKGNEKLKDPKTAEPIGIDTVFNDFIVSEGYVKAPSGRGGTDEYGKGSGFGNIDSPTDFTEQWQRRNPDKPTTSPDYRKDYQDWMSSKKQPA